MNESEELIERLNQEGILVDEAILSTLAPDASGLYVTDSSGAAAILINNKLSEREKRCILAEEAGHHYRTVGNVIDASTTFARKQEGYGRSWAYNWLMSLEHLAQVCIDHESMSIWDIADALNVTEEFLINAINHYRDKYGCLVELPDGVIVQFEPYFDVYRTDD